MIGMALRLSNVRRIFPGLTTVCVIGLCPAFTHVLFEDLEYMF